MPCPHRLEDVGLGTDALVLPEIGQEGFIQRLVEAGSHADDDQYRRRAEDQCPESPAMRRYGGGRFPSYEPVD